jgi:hypothetical protein
MRYFSARIESFRSGTVRVNGIGAASEPIKNHHWCLATYKDLHIIGLREITLAIKEYSGNAADCEDTGYAPSNLETITSFKGSIGTTLIILSAGLKRTDQN